MDQQEIHKNGSPSSTALHGEQLDKFIDKMSHASGQAVETTKKAVDKSVHMVKEYPIHSALGAGAVGFVAGYLTNKFFKN